MASCRYNGSRCHEPRRPFRSKDTPMRRGYLLALVIAGGGLLTYAFTDAAAQPMRKPFGLEKRVPWTTSKVIGSPEPPPAYRAERAFAKLKFEEPLDLT